MSGSVGEARRLEVVSGTDITFGAETEFVAAGVTSYCSVAVLSSTAFVVAYLDGSDFFHGTAKVGTVSGTDITFGAESEFLSATLPSSIAACALSSTAFVVAYRDEADLNHGTAKVGTVTGTAIAFGAEAEFNAAGITVSISVVALSATKFVVAYQDQADGNHGTAKVGTVSGTAITFGAEAEFLSAAVDQTSVAALSATKFVVAYGDGSDSGHGTSKVGTVSGTDIMFGAEAEFNGGPGASDELSAAALSASGFVVGYRDIADSQHGTAKVGTLSSAASLASPTPGEYDSAAGATKVGFCGWFKKPSA